MKNSSIDAAKVAGAGALAVLLATSVFADDRPQDSTWRDRQHRDGSVSRESGERPRDNSNRSDGYRNNDNHRNSDNHRNNDNHRNSDNHRNNDGYRNNDNRSNDRNRSYDRNRWNDRNRSYDRDRYERYNSSHTYRNNDRIRMHGRINHYYHERGGYRVWIDGGRYSYWVPEVYWRPNWRVGIDISLGGIFRDGVIYSEVYDDPYYEDGYYNDGYYNDGRGYADDILSGYVERVDYRTGSMWVRDGRSGREFVVDTRSIDPRYNRIDARDVQRGDRVTFVGSFARGGVFIADRIDAINTR